MPFDKLRAHSSLFDRLRARCDGLPFDKLRAQCDWLSFDKLRAHLIRNRGTGSDRRRVVG